MLNIFENAPLLFTFVCFITFVAILYTARNSFHANREIAEDAARSVVLNRDSHPLIGREVFTRFPSKRYPSGTYIGYVVRVYTFSNRVRIYRPQHNDFVRRSMDRISIYDVVQNRMVGVA